MKVIDKMSYALWIEHNAKMTTVGLYKVVGSDLKELLPHIVRFNKAAAGKVAVQNPMPCGEARAYTWKQIVGRGFDKDVYAYCGPDGSNMSDEDVLNYYWNANHHGTEANSKSKEDFLHHLDALVVETAVDALVVETAVDNDGLSDAEKKAVMLMDEARKAAEAAATAMEKAIEANKGAMAERGQATTTTN